MAYLSQTTDTEKKIDVNLCSSGSRGWQIQVFFGSAYATLYMGFDEARQFANDLLRVLPEEEYTTGTDGEESQ